jgi:hypothetical protein
MRSPIKFATRIVEQTCSRPYEWKAIENSLQQKTDIPHIELP